MLCNFKAVILWSLINLPASDNFWVCGVGSAGKEDFLSPDHMFLLGILITSFNCFCTFFLASLSCSWGASPISGSLERQPEVVAVARIAPVAEAGLSCLVVSGHALQSCWPSKPLQGLAACCPSGEGPGSSPEAAVPCPLSLLSCSQGAWIAWPGGLSPTCQACCRDVLFPEDSWRAETLSSRGLFPWLMTPVSRAPVWPCSQQGTERHGAFPEILQGHSDTAGLIPLLLPSRATSLGHGSFIFLESTVDVFQRWLCTSAAIAQWALRAYLFRKQGLYPVTVFSVTSSRALWALVVSKRELLFSVPCPAWNQASPRHVSIALLCDLFIPMFFQGEWGGAHSYFRDQCTNMLQAAPFSASWLSEVVLI